MNWETATVQRRAEGFWLRRTLEAIQIREATPNMNLDSGLLLPMVWKPTPYPLHALSPILLLENGGHFGFNLIFVHLVNRV